MTRTRTPRQTAANKLDLALFRVESQIAAMDEKEWFLRSEAITLRRSIGGARAIVRRYLHPDDLGDG